jgi:hypothetical protein
MHNDRLATRWHELVRLVEEQFLEHRQHPGGGVFKSDSEDLKLSGILNDGGYFTVTLSEEQVLKGDLPRIANDFYDAYRAESDKP